jgi:hypothetical protein
MYKVEVNKCTIYARGVFIYFAETIEEEIECQRLGMHPAEEYEIIVGMQYDNMMMPDCGNILIN